MKDKFNFASKFFIGSILPTLLQLIIIPPIIGRAPFDTGGGLEGAGSFYSMEVLYILIIMPTSFLLTFIGTGNSSVSPVNSFLLGCFITIIVPLVFLYIIGFPINFSEPPFTG